MEKPIIKVSYEAEDVYRGDIETATCFHISINGCSRYGFYCKDRSLADRKWLVDIVKSQLEDAYLQGASDQRKAVASKWKEFTEEIKS